MPTIEQLQAENKRLGEALEKIKMIADDPHTYAIKLNFRGIDTYAYSIGVIQSTAKIALNEKNHQ